jgi:hypothetical protein
MVIEIAAFLAMTAAFLAMTGIPLVSVIASGTQWSVAIC